MTSLIDNIHFHDLSKQNPDDVCKRALCRYDHSEKCYTLFVWGEEYKVFPHQFTIECAHENVQGYHDYFYLFILHYLLKSKGTKIKREWISEKDIPGGTTFFRGPHIIPTDFITARFQNNIQEFKEKCEALYGSPIVMADAAFVFEITPIIPVAVLYWTGDNEFPAESKILYDKSIIDHFALDIIFALAVGICEKLGRPD
jgi:Domain of unknown function (DUF3786)